LLAYGRWFSPDTPASSTTKTGRHDIACNIAESGVKHKKSYQIKSFFKKSFNYTKGETRGRYSKDIKIQWPQRTKTIPHVDLQNTTQKIEQHEHHLKQGVNSDPENCQCTSHHRY
jgi:hypothetical protein